MNDDVGAQWINVARFAETRLAGCERRARREIIERLAADHGVSPNTVRRALAAYSYVRTEAASYGVPIDAVAGSMSSIETLKRIARLSPDTAAAYARLTLLGRMTYQSLLSLSASLEVQARDESTEQAPALDADAVFLALVRDLRPLGTFVAAGERSAFARAARAEFELVRSDRGAGGNAVAILAPGWASSIDRGTAEEVGLLLLGASMVFVRTYYVVETRMQWTEMKGLLARTALDPDRLRPFVPRRTLSKA